MIIVIVLVTICTVSSNAVLRFRRSVTMDSWSQDQLKKMQLGGNAKLNAFLKQYGVEKNMDIKDKYNGRAAEVRVHTSRLVLPPGVMLVDVPWRSICPQSAFI
jgi:hypothetical protein